MTGMEKARHVPTLGNSPSHVWYARTNLYVSRCDSLSCCDAMLGPQPRCHGGMLRLHTHAWRVTWQVCFPGPPTHTCSSNIFKPSASSYELVSYRNCSCHRRREVTATTVHTQCLRYIVNQRKPRLTRGCFFLRTV